VKKTSLFQIIDFHADKTKYKKNQISAYSLNDMEKKTFNVISFGLHHVEKKNISSHIIIIRCACQSL